MSLEDMNIHTTITDASAIIVPEPPAEEQTDPKEIIRDKIIGILSVYPVISATMLQAALGPSLSPSLWRPVFESMVERKEIEQYEESPEDLPGERSRPFPCIKLAQN